MPKNTKILCVRASGGLANRLLALAGGIAYALLTERNLCVDWRDGLYSDDASNVFPLWFEINDIETCTCEESITASKNGASLTPHFWKTWLSEPVAVEYLFEGNSHMTPESYVLSSIDTSNLCVPDDIAVYWHWSAKAAVDLAPLLRKKVPALAHVTDTAMPAAILNIYVSPTASLRDEANTFFDQHFSKAPVGIHIRHSDLQSPLPRMLQKLQEIASANDNVFLCTDNEHVENMVRRLFPHVVTQKKIYQGTGVPLHSYVPGISNVQKGREALLDMLVLAKCAHIIHYAPSTFATIPAFWSQLPQDCIHSVE